MGIEPTYSAWKADILAVESHPQNMVPKARLELARNYFPLDFKSSVSTWFHHLGIWNGGEGRIRTTGVSNVPDLQSGAIATRHTSPYMVPPEGIEPPTSWLQVSCTASCAMVAYMAGKMGFEPMPSRSQSVRPTKLSYFPIYGVKYENRTRITGATVQCFTIKLTSPSLYGGHWRTWTSDQPLMRRWL